MANGLPTIRNKKDATHLRLGSANGYAALMWLLSGLFALRVLGQALQRWLPQTFLPDFHDFQGSNLPYWLLLSAQLAILALMAVFARRVQIRKLHPNRRTGQVLACAGGVYMAGSLVRIIIGLTLPVAPAWFEAWISAIFHLVLAGFVITLATYHLRLSQGLFPETRK